MPLYEYKCRTCGEVFEVLQRASDSPPPGCRRCSGAVDKLVSQSAFQLKGSGWYVTDYARKGAKGKKDEGAAGKPDASAPAGDKSAAPAAGKAEAKPVSTGSTPSA